MSGDGLRALEFFSGIGGLHYALLQAAPQASVVQAFDLNPVANLVYQHNFGLKPKQVNIEGVAKAEVDRLGAQIWLLSPPCQPFTVRGLRKDSADARTRGFLKLLSLLSGLDCQPKYLFIENVVGFRTSTTHDLLLQVLETNNFAVEEFILSPTDYLIPNSRPRYFCLAWKSCVAVEARDSGRDEIRRQPPFLDPVARTLSAGTRSFLRYYLTKTYSEEGCRPAATANAIVTTDTKDSRIGHDPASAISGGDDCTIKGLLSGIASPAAMCHGSCKDSTTTGSDLGNGPLFEVPLRVLNDHADVVDVVTSGSTCCNCFTKTYTQYTKGTGSLLATANVGREWVKSESARDSLVYGAVDGKRLSKEQLALQMSTLGLRYFTPREIANLHFFPQHFSFPDSITDRQKYQLLGNSLNVLIAADLLVYLLHKHTNRT